MKRLRPLARIADLFKTHPIVTLVGPRQCGKTTLALELARARRSTWGPIHHFDLEDAVDLARLANPRLALEGLEGLVIIDEVQRRPDLFPTLRVLVDRAPKRARFLVLGSASGELLRQGSESLAGRTAFLELTPFALYEVPSVDRLWLRGGYPRAYLARSDRLAFDWLDNYIATFLERDIPSFGIRVPAVALRRFWSMLAHVHGNVLNHSELGRAFGATNKTIAHYLDILASTFMVRLLPPWFENISKRQVKAPKLLFRDSGLLHRLLDMRSEKQLLGSPRVGASWEGFAIESVIRELGLRTGEVYFWATHADAELDLFAIAEGTRFGFEVKRADAPKVTRSMNIALGDLGLSHLFAIYPGEDIFPLTEQITAIGLGRLGSLRALMKRHARARGG